MDWTHKLRLRHVKMLLSLAQTQQSESFSDSTECHPTGVVVERPKILVCHCLSGHARGLVPTPYGQVLIAHAARLEAQRIEPVTIWRKVEGGPRHYRRGAAA